MGRGLLTGQVQTLSRPVSQTTTAFTLLRPDGQQQQRHCCQAGLEPAAPWWRSAEQRGWFGQNQNSRGENTLKHVHV